MEQVFELIKSLSQSEKRYFRMETSKYQSEDSPDYWQLYEWMERQDSYDEERLKRAFRGKNWLGRLASVKNYLYNQLLKTLTIFHAESKSSYQVNWLLQQIDILFQRGLYKQARKLLNKAKKLAQQYDIAQALLAINRWEYIFADLNKQPWKMGEELGQIHEEERVLLQDLGLRMQVEHLHELVIYHMYQHGVPRTEEDQAVYRNFLAADVLAQEPERVCGWYIRDLQISIKGLAHYMLLQKAEAHEYAKERLVRMEALPHILLEENRDYWVAVFNVIQTLYTQERYAEAAEQLEKARCFLTNPKLQISKRAEEFIFLLHYYHMPQLWKIEGRFEEILALHDEALAGYKQWDKQEHKNRVLFMIPLTMATAHFVMEQYERGLAWVECVLQDRSNTVRPDSMGMARILHLLLQYEMGRHTILEHYIDSAQRYIKEYANMLTFEQLFLRLIRQLVQLPKGAAKQQQQLLETARQELQIFMQNDCFEKRCIQEHHLLSWLDSKIQQRSFKAVVIEKQSKGIRE